MQLAMVKGKMKQPCYLPLQTLVTTLAEQEPSGRNPSLHFRSPTMWQTLNIHYVLEALKV